MLLPGGFSEDSCSLRPLEDTELVLSLSYKPAFCGVHASPQTERETERERDRQRERERERERERRRGRKGKTEGGRDRERKQILKTWTSRGKRGVL